MGDLLGRTVVVLNDSDGHADARTRRVLAEQFRTRGQVVLEVPFDARLRRGGVIAATDELAATTRRGFLEVAAVVVSYFTGFGAAGRRRAPVS
jgi:hypothetical protein